MATAFLNDIRQIDDHPEVQAKVLSLAAWQGRYHEADNAIGELSASVTAASKNEARVEALKEGRDPEETATSARDQQRRIYQQRRDAAGVVASLKRDLGNARAKASKEVADAVRPKITRLVARQAKALRELAVASRDLENALYELEVRGYVVASNFRNVKFFHDHEDPKRYLAEMAEAYPEAKIEVE
jgi:hypothetical protein